MPKIGEMTEMVDQESGEIVGFHLDTAMREVPRMKAVPNQRQNGEGAPEFLLVAGRNEVGAMWKKGPDRNGKTFYELKLNGYPLRETWYMRAFHEGDGLFNLDYSAPQAPKAAGQGDG